MGTEKNIGEIKLWLIILSFVLRKELERIKNIELLPAEKLKEYVGDKVFEIVGGDTVKTRKVVKASAAYLNDFIILLDEAEERLRKGDRQKALILINLITAKLENLLPRADIELYEKLNSAKKILENTIPCA